MTSPRRTIIRPFRNADPTAVVELLRGASPEYLRWFHPFAYDEETIAGLAFAGLLDQWFVIEIEQGGGFQIAGFYMLRGMDEGFTEPIYGVFIAERFAGFGLARLTLAHAEAMCRLNGWPNLLLKVDPANTRAFGLYEASGFRFLRPDPATGYQVLIKPLSTPTPRPALQT